MVAMLNMVILIEFLIIKNNFNRKRLQAQSFSFIQFCERVSKPLGPSVELACQYLQSVDVNGPSIFINTSMKELSLIEAATKILNEVKNQKMQDPQIWGRYAYVDGKSRLYAFDVFEGNKTGELSPEDYKKLSTQAEKNGASFGNDWHDSPFSRQIDLATVKREIAKYKKEIAEKTKLVKSFEKQLSAL